MKNFQAIIFIFSLLGISCSGSPVGEEDSLTIAVSANTMPVMREIIPAFARRYGDSCHLVAGSSGKLVSQIKQGAPYDVLVSADEYYPKQLAEAGLTLGVPRRYARGVLVLWAGQKGSVPAGIQSLLSPEVHRIALANPRTAPYGIAAKKALERLGLWGRIEEKLVFGESISQVNQFVLTGSAEIGFTSKSSIYLQPDSTWAEVDTGAYPPIQQAAVALRGTPGKNERAKRFVDFLCTPAAQAIFKRYGYIVLD